MIEIEGVYKNYEGFPAIKDLTLSIEDGKVFGMVGMNGAGKTTLLRLMAGVLLQERGTIKIDGEFVFNNASAKAKLFFIPDELYFFTGATGFAMAEYYSNIYPGFMKDRFYGLLNDFGLDGRRRIAGFSKGMKKQMAIILGLCASTRYLFCDETFDGLDPLMRRAVKYLLEKDMKERGLTPVLTSHNLRELADVCNHLGILHQGGVLLSRDVADQNTDLRKFHCVFADRGGEKRLSESLKVRYLSHQGSLCIFTVKNTAEEIAAAFAQTPVVFWEMLPLSPEEIFINETEGVGYDITKIIGN